MEILHSHNIFSYFSILSLLHLSSLFFPSTSYELPDRYFINCGSSSTVPIHGKNFIGDENPAGNYVLSSHGSNPVEDPTFPADELYQSARKFSKSSSYELDLNETGIYIVRFHFFLSPFLGNPSDAHFSVSTSGVSLLPNFTSGNNHSPVQEFLFEIPRGKFKINFKPYNKQSFAYVNAIEVFLAPPDFIRHNATYVTQNGSDHEFGDILKTPLQTIHRINVGEGITVPDNDTMLRSWGSDDDYLLHGKETAKKSELYTGTPKYQSGGATNFDAPDLVYRTARQSLNDSNVTWSFDVRKLTNHLVRLHFCDIVSRTSNEFNYFNLYIYRNFRKVISPYNYTEHSAAPFYIDFVVYSDDLEFINISIGPDSGSQVKMAFLNGVEIMEVSRGGDSSRGPNDSTRKHLLIVVGSSVGGGVFLLMILIMIVVGLRKKKWKAIESFDWPLVPLNGGSSYSRTTVRTSVGSTIADLNLGLKVPLSEILLATKQFDSKMMVGGGGFGKVYKGVLRNGTKVAVKRSEPGLDQGLPEFQTEIILLSKIRHHHLVSLIGYCDERNEMILVYEFMENGTLRDHLYKEGNRLDPRTRFSWEQRLQICIGAGKGLNYLHTGSTGTIIHRDIKSTNILLDEDYVAKVADFGLSRSGPFDQTHVVTEVKGSFGYLDPEYFRCFLLTQKSDVYSFGVVLLEILCARPVIDQSLPKEEVNLADWGMLCLREGELQRIIDPVLEGKINPSSLRKFGETVEKCLEECGADRPNMVDVLWDLEYCLQLQQHSAVSRQAYEDSSNNDSWGVPLSVVQRLPSNSFVDGEDPVHGFSDASQVNGSQVFSLLNINEAR
ncbi:hypothetical protein ACS0TY_006276 [Phlomoides rotata]